MEEDEHLIINRDEMGWDWMVLELRMSLVQEKNNRV